MADECVANASQLSAPVLKWSGHMRVADASGLGAFGHAALIANPTELRLTSELGEFTFPPHAIECAERVGVRRWAWTGIRIRHRVADYPERIHFYPVGVTCKQILDLLGSVGVTTRG